MNSDIHCNLKFRKFAKIENMKTITWSEFMSPEVITTATDENGVEYEIDQNGTIEIPENEEEFKRVAPSGSLVIVPPKKTIES